MSSSYQVGLAAVVGTVLLSAGVCLAFVNPRPAPAPAGQDLGPGGFDLGSYRLVERSGRTVTEADLADEVWVASFVFTRCPTSCPRISARMRELQGKLRETGVRLVSLSVDPEHDTPEVLTSYAERYGADPDRWWMLTGPQDEVYDLILDRFKLSVSQTTEDDRKAGAEAVAHSDKLALVGRGNRVVGFFASDDESAIANLVGRARLLDTEGSWVRRLPAVNASLNATCAVLLVVAWSFILAGRWRWHAATMLAAVAVSALFLGSYLVYHYFVGSVAYRGTGLTRLAYFTILLSHTALATFGVVPLVGLTLFRAYRRQFGRHARIAAVTFPIWLYVSVTGVVIYWMLYQMPMATSPG